MKDELLKIKTYLLSGVSFAIPFIASGGILIAAAIALAPMGPHGADFSASPNLRLILTIGETAFRLVPAVLAGYIAHAMAAKPGLVPGFVGGFLANEVKAGFLGALVAGLLAGYLVNLIKKLPVPAWLRPVMPILIIPILSTLVIGVLMLHVLGVPIAELMASLKVWLETMSTGNAVLLAVLLGAMIAFDMGGPVNKVAFGFAAGLISQGNVAIMGCVAAAICTPPLGLGLATLLRRRLWSEEERDAGGAALAMGCIGITEGAIPFAAADPVRIIPCLMAGSSVAAAVAMTARVGDHAPHGGPIVLPVVDHRFMYVVAILAGTLVTALAVTFVKSRQTSSSSS
ncbi:PTS fructose transporter subunit IIC [Opitutus sp. ER46]|uniref:PTS fructose transporter subunit IIC n=1 Tax=Opitutus sp. ER46 TaxID=2161864 RepID=UPI000D30DE80|nr:PTS fructose transporter subunit IIC [Opitutus sp. ER46]PTX99073.1 PTS fructose-like transporter subunit EIIC [Opitutus sp. ER46]